jgi:biotin operon repressor
LTAFAGVAGTADHGAMRYRTAMEESTESLRQQLLAARENVERQIDKLRARPYPVAAGPGGKVLHGIAGLVRTNGVMIDNDELIAKLTKTLREIDESLKGLENSP